VVLRRPLINHWPYILSYTALPWGIYTMVAEGGLGGQIALSLCALGTLFLLLLFGLLISRWILVLRLHRQEVGQGISWVAWCLSLLRQKPEYTLLILLSVSTVLITVFYGAFVVQSTTNALYDRYMSPVVCWLCLIFLSAVETRARAISPVSESRMRVLVSASYVVLISFAVITLQGYSSLQRAILAQENRLLSAGVARVRFSSSHFRDLGAQLAVTDHIPLLETDPLRRQTVWPLPQEEKIASRVPAVNPEWMIRLAHEPELLQTDYPPEPYYFMLPPFRRYVYIERVPLLRKAGTASVRR